ncbi:hypothetical protein D3C87_1648030 [compost metagenome]
MQGPAFGRRDDEGGGARLRRAGQFDDGRGVQGARGDLDGAARGGAGPIGEVAAQDGHAQLARAGRKRGQHGFGGVLRAGGIVGVRPLQRIVGGGQVAGAGRERPQVIQAAHKRKRTGAGQAAIGRLQAKDAAQGRRYANGPVGVGPQGQRHESARDGGRATTG